MLAIGIDMSGCIIPAAAGTCYSAAWRFSR